MAGLIAGAGFASGDRVVVGCWASSPIGPFGDVMWAAPDGRRTLWAPSATVAEFVGAVYRFDHVEVGGLEVQGTIAGLTASTPAWSLRVDAAPRGFRIPFRRPAWMTRFVEAPVARAWMGVRPYGVSPTGVREWYRADAWRRIVAGSLTWSTALTLVRSSPSTHQPASGSASRPAARPSPPSSPCSSTRPAGSTRSSPGLADPAELTDTDATTGAWGRAAPSRRHPSPSRADFSLAVVLPRSGARFRSPGREIGRQTADTRCDALVSPRRVGILSPRR